MPLGKKGSHERGVKEEQPP